MDVIGVERAVTSFAEGRLPVDFTEARIIAGTRVVNVGLLARAINAQAVTPLRETWDWNRIRDASLRLRRGRYHPYPESMPVSATMMSKAALVARCADGGDYLLDGLTRVEAAHRAGMDDVDVLVVTEAQVIAVQGDDRPARVLNASLARPVVSSRVNTDPYVFRVVQMGVARVESTGRRRYTPTTSRLADAFYVSAYDLILLHGMRSGGNGIESRSASDEVTLALLETELGYDLLDCSLKHFRKALNDSLRRGGIEGGRRQYEARLSDEIEAGVRILSPTSPASVMDALWTDAVVAHRRLMMLFRAAKRLHLDQSDLARIEAGDASADLRNLRFVVDVGGCGDNTALTLADLIAVAVDHGVNGAMLVPAFAFATYLLQWWVQIHNIRSSHPTKPDLAMAEIYLCRRCIAIRGEVDRWSPFWLDIFDALSTLPPPTVISGGIADWDVAILRHLRGADLDRDLDWRGDQDNVQSR